MSEALLTMRGDYETHCQKFEHRGRTFYDHAHDCKCAQCYAGFVLGGRDRDLVDSRVVTFNDWDRDLHWYQCYKSPLDKEYAADVIIDLRIPEQPNGKESPFASL